jgi:putative ABC transport system permease protein
MGIPVIRGRGIEARDADGAPRVVVINQTMKNRYWPDSDPIGERNSFRGPDSFATIVGIVGDTRVESVGDEPYSQAYAPFAQQPTRVMGIAARITTDPRQAAAQLRRAVKDLDPSLPLAQVQSMDAYVKDSLARPRVSMLVLGIFAAVALVLAAIGIYGVTTFAVSQRTREIGVRIALGAAKTDVIQMIVRQGMIPVITGLAIGIAGAWAATRAMRSVLYGISNTDPITYVVIAIFLAIVAFVAALIPARRATRVDPVEALRSEG